MDATSPHSIRSSDQLAMFLRNLRLSRRMTQRDLAARLGLSQPRVAEIEGKPGRITVDQLFAVMHALGASVLVAPDRVAEVARDASGAVVGEPSVTTRRKEGEPPEGEW